MQSRGSVYQSPGLSRRLWRKCLYLHLAVVGLHHSWGVRVQRDASRQTFILFCNFWRLGVGMVLWHRCRLGGLHTRMFAALRCETRSRQRPRQVMAPPSFSQRAWWRSKGGRKGGTIVTHSSTWRIQGYLRVLKSGSASLNLLWKEEYPNDEKDEVASEIGARRRNWRASIQSVEPPVTGWASSKKLFQQKKRECT